MTSILIQNADWVVTMNPERQIFADGAVRIENDRIVEVGKTAALAGRAGADVVIDARGKLVLPGLIDTHVHNTQQLGRGLELLVLEQALIFIARRFSHGVTT